VVSGYTMRSASIVVTNGCIFAPGDYAEIREDNDAAWGASDWAPKVVGQILHVPQERSAFPVADERHAEHRERAAR
jgi:hypothetical protein